MSKVIEERTTRLYDIMRKHHYDVFQRCVNIATMIPILMGIYDDPVKIASTVEQNLIKLAAELLGVEIEE